MLLTLATGCSALLPAIQDPGFARQELPPIPPPVQMPPDVPKPKPGEPVETWSVSVEDVPIRELLFALARDAAVDMDVDPGIEERVTMNAVDEPLSRLLHRISRHADLRVETEDGILVVRRDEPVLRTYPIDYVPLDRETETVNEVGTGVGSGIEAPSGEENGSAANVRARTEHRFWDALVESVRGVLGEAPDGAARVFAHRETSLIAVRASAAVHRDVARLLDRILASARRQVLIEATIVEVELDDRFRAGVDFSRVFGDVAIESSLLGGNLGVPPFAGLSIPDLSLTVRLLGEFGDVRVLSTPLVMALNNQTAIVKIAENRVFFTSEVRTETSEATVERNVQTKLHTVPVGLILLVTPSVAADDEIILKIRPTVTRESGFAVDPNPELAAAGVVSRIPEIAVREIESVLRLRSGEVAVLGGLMREEAREDTTGIPVLSRLPGIGAAFRYRDRDRDKTELIVFLRPTVIRDPNLAGELAKYRRWWPVAGGPVAPNRVPRPLGRTDPGPSGVVAAPPAPFGRDGERRLRIDRSRARNPADGLVDRAWTALRRGDHRTARAAYLEVLDTRPEDALAGLATTALREGRTAEARAWYLRLATLDPEQEAARTMSFVLDRSEEPAAREREIARRVSLAPETAWLQVALGNALAAQDSWEAANDAYRAARRAAPSHPDPAYNLAVSADRRARPRIALAHYRDALDLAALSPPAFDVRAVRERAGALARLTMKERPTTAGATGSPSLESVGLDPLVTLLLETGVISEDQARIALTEQSQTGDRIADILARLGFVTDAIVRDAVGGALGVESVDLGRTVAEAEAMAAVPEPVARRFMTVGLTLEHDAEGIPRRLTVAMADPFDVIALDHLRSLFSDNLEIVPFLAGRSDIERFLERAYRHDLTVSGILHEIETGEADPVGLPVNTDEYSQPIVRLVDVLLSDAVKRRASDVHFEPEAGFLRVRYRIDGVLRQVRSLHRSYWSAIAVRLKVLCGMNIAETRAPQDGRMTLSVSGRDIDFRVSSLPTAHGENIVLRVLDRSQGISSLDDLGMSPHALAELRRMLERPEGVILVTGPTGSGKTTTLYSILAHLDREAVNIMTLEDPVEYPMARIRQTSVNEAVKLDFANGVRSLLRQDPDIILVGEVRDADTAAMTFRAAMTGHQVYSTLHANSAVGAIPRLLDIGVAPGVLAGNIIGIVAQRLVRRLCPECREPTDSLVGAFAREGNRMRAASEGPSSGGDDVDRQDAEPGPAYQPFRPRGCPRCDHQGYRGRLALTEVLRFDAEIDALVARGAPAHELLEAAERQGFVTLARDAVRRVADGSSTIEEISRAVDLTRDTSRAASPPGSGRAGTPETPTAIRGAPEPAAPREGS